MKVSLSLPLPVSEDKDSEWKIEMELIEMRPLFKQTVYGIDAIQALEMALMVLRTVEEKEGLEIPEN